MAFMMIVFEPSIALAIAIMHMLIDTRIPISLWQKLYKQTTEGAYAIHVSIWLDQVFHIAILYLVVKIIESA
jgi:hypothetical protein